MSTERDWQILKLDVKTKSSRHQIDLYEDLRISPQTIDTDFCEQPAKYAYWAVVAAQAKALVDRKRLEVDKQEDYIKKSLTGQLDAEVRMQLEMDGEKVTEGKVINGIYAHEKYQEAQDQLYELREELSTLQENWAYLEMAKESMNQRKDMLISLGAQLRQEGGNVDLKIKEQAAKIVKSSKNRRMEE